MDRLVFLKGLLLKKTDYHWERRPGPPEEGCLMKAPVWYLVLVFTNPEDVNADDDIMVVDPNALAGKYQSDYKAHEIAAHCEPPVRHETPKKRQEPDDDEASSRTA